jgi:hypothetical protein
MLRLVSRAQIAYFGLFLIACVAIFAYDAAYVWPLQRCEAHGGWWSDKYRMCAQPIPIWRITGRMPKAMPASPPPPKSPVS